MPRKQQKQQEKSGDRPIEGGGFFDMFSSLTPVQKAQSEVTRLETALGEAKKKLAEAEQTEQAKATPVVATPTPTTSPPPAEQPGLFSGFGNFMSRIFPSSQPPQNNKEEDKTRVGGGKHKRSTKRLRRKH